MATLCPAAVRPSLPTLVESSDQNRPSYPTTRSCFTPTSRAVRIRIISSPARARSRGSLLGFVAGSGTGPGTLSGSSSEGEESKLGEEIGGGGGGGGGEGSRRGPGGGGGGDGDGSGEQGQGDSEERDDGGQVKEMARMSMSQKLTLGYAALVGVGGLVGYLKSGSQKSLAAGGFSALLLYFVHRQLSVRPAFASSVGLGLSAALLAIMGSRFKKSGKIFPAGIVSFISFVMVGGYFHGILRSLHA